MIKGLLGVLTGSNSDTHHSLQKNKHPFNGLFSMTTWVSRYQKEKTSLDLNEARYDGAYGCSGISWTICKQSAPRSRHITKPTPHHSIFIGWMLFHSLQNEINVNVNVKATKSCPHAFLGWSFRLQERPLCHSSTNRRISSAVNLMRSACHTWQLKSVHVAMLRNY